MKKTKHDTQPQCPATVITTPICTQPVNMRMRAWHVCQMALDRMLGSCNSTYKAARSFLDLVLSADSDSEAPKASRSSPDQVLISEQ